MRQVSNSLSYRLYFPLAVAELSQPLAWWFWAGAALFASAWERWTASASLGQADVPACGCAAQPELIAAGFRFATVAGGGTAASFRHSCLRCFSIPLAIIPVAGLGWSSVTSNLAQYDPTDEG